VSPSCFTIFTKATVTSGWPRVVRAIAGAVLVNALSLEMLARQLTFAFMVLLPTTATADPSTAEHQQADAHLQRFASTARLWARIKWISPALAYGKIDWDQALVDALPLVAAAESEKDRVDALNRLLAPLKDPAARVGRPEKHQSASGNTHDRLAASPGRTDSAPSTDGTI
jgi:hypothetical protein